MAQFTFFRFTELISHVLFYLFDVNCAFLAVTNFAFATKPFDVSLEYFALCGERPRSLPSGHPPPFKKRGRKLYCSWFYNTFERNSRRRWFCGFSKNSFGVFCSII